MTTTDRQQAAILARYYDNEVARDRVLALARAVEAAGEAALAASAAAAAADDYEAARMIRATYATWVECADRAERALRGPAFSAPLDKEGA